MPSQCSRYCENVPLIGLHSSPSEVRFYPYTKLVCLEFVLDSVQMKIYLTNEKIAKLKSICAKLIKAQKKTLHGKFLGPLGIWYLVSHESCMAPSISFNPLPSKRFPIDE